MGIASSSDNGMKQAKACILGDMSMYHWVKNSCLEATQKEWDALFAPKLEEKSTDIDAEADARYVEFMKGGGCKETYNVYVDCVDEFGYGSKNCEELAGKVYNCMCSHPDYYQPMLTAFKSVEEHLVKERDAYLAKKQALRDDALAARNQTLRDEFRRFR